MYRNPFHNPSHICMELEVKRKNICQTQGLLIEIDHIFLIISAISLERVKKPCSANELILVIQIFLFVSATYQY